MPAGATARCVRCDAILFRTRVNSIDRTLAWTIAGLALYGVAVSFPFLSMQSGAITQKTALLSGVKNLYQQGEITLAILVLLTCVLIPLLQMCGLLYVFIPLKMKLRVKHTIHVFRIFQHLRPWSMMEIYMLGILVAMVKLGEMADIVPGLAAIAFGLLIFVLTFAISSVDSHLVWQRLGEES